MTPPTSHAPPAPPLTDPRIRALVPPGGFANTVGHWLTALDLGLAEIREGAAACPGEFWTGAAPATKVPPPLEILLEAARTEAAWVHQGIGGERAAEAPPAAAKGLAACLAHWDAVRKTTWAVLKPLVDRDLDTLRAVPGREGKTTVRRILADLIRHQAQQWGQVTMLARLRA